MRARDGDRDPRQVEAVDGGVGRTGVGVKSAPACSRATSASIADSGRLASGALPRANRRNRRSARKRKTASSGSRYEVLAPISAIMLASAMRLSSEKAATASPTISTDA